METYWGIDLGGTKIEGVVLKSLDKLDLLARERIDTEQEHGYEHIVMRIGKVIEILKQKTGITPAAVGVGHPGVVDPRTGLLKNSNTVCLNGKPLKSDLEKHIGLSTVFSNDANCFALAEACFGAAREWATVFGVIMGTGVGGGVVFNRQALIGVQGIAGEWGHNVLIPNGAPCY
jgi:fructokinase